jgi:hypothetical protein
VAGAKPHGCRSLTSRRGIWAVAGVDADLEPLGHDSRASRRGRGGRGVAAPMTGAGEALRTRRWATMAFAVGASGARMVNLTTVFLRRP